MSYQNMPMIQYPAHYFQYSFIGHMKTLVCHYINQTGGTLSDEQIGHMTTDLLARFPTEHLVQGGIEIDLETTLRDILITSITSKVMNDLAPMFEASHEVAIADQICAMDHAELEESVEPIKPVKSADSVESIKPVKPADSVESIKPIKPVKPSEKKTSETPDVSETVETPITPKKPAEKKIPNTPNAPKKPTEKKKPISWAEQTAREDAAKAEYDSVCSALRARLPWSQRVTSAEKSIEQLIADVEAHELATKVNSQKMLTSVVETCDYDFPTAKDLEKQATKPAASVESVKPATSTVMRYKPVKKQSESEEKTTKPVQMYGASIDGHKGLKMFSVPPKKTTNSADSADSADSANSANPTSDWTVVGKKTEKSSGKIQKKSMFSVNEVKSKIYFENQYPQNAKKVTSLKWFATDLPILPEECDFFLWDYDSEGIPYGWIKIGNNKWIVNRSSQFIHTRHMDKPDEYPLGYWTHEEYYQVKGKDETKPVSVPYLTYCLIPMPLRRGAPPAY